MGGVGFEYIFWGDTVQPTTSEMAPNQGTL